jgi:hypothetical protein
MGAGEVAEADGPRGPAPGSQPESYARLLANVAGVVVALAAVAAVQLGTIRPRATPPAVVRSTPPTSRFDPDPTTKPLGPVKSKTVAAPAPPPPAPEPPKLDGVAVAKAEADLDAASRDRARAEGRTEEAARRLRDASTRAVVDARNARTLAFRVRDPSARIAAASTRGGFLKAERDQLKGEVAALARVPRPTAKVLSNKNPVARPAEGGEQHFELRRNRVTYIDLDGLLEKVKADAQLRLRLSEGARVVDARIGPIGAFSLQYTMARTLPAGLDDLIGRRGVRYDLRGWEVVPEFEGRGETFESTRQPFSEFARVVNRLTPARNTITLWVYSDSFPLFRKLRDDLHARGYRIAARPLPEAIAIRGSPSGSLSAGQ